MTDPLKNAYNRAYLLRLAEAISASYPQFSRDQLLSSVFRKDWSGLELKDRMHRIADALHLCFDQDYKLALRHLKAAAAPFGGFEGMFFPDYVERYGMHAWQASINALGHFTKYSSSEFAVRPFIIQDQNRMMAQLQKWASHKNEHLRRLASEGCRPRLPWAIALPAFKRNPEPVIAILELLKQDPSVYVRRSVANNLNDISKDHPQRVLKIADAWLGKNPDTDWIVKHACRGLLKAGNSQAMRLFGFADPHNVHVTNLRTTKQRVAIGDDMRFSCSVSGPQQEFLRLEFAIDYCKKNGSHSRKVFKISESVLSNGQKEIDKRHAFKQLTTRVHYPGKHHLHIIVNGIVKASTSFTLV